MASVVDICNLALSHIGAEGVVTAIDPPDGSVEAGHCATFWPIVRRQAIEAAHPSSAKKRVELAEVANTSEVWAYAYELPSDCLKPLRVLKLSEASAMLFADADVFVSNENDSAKFELEGSVLRTNEPEAVLLYLFDQTNPSLFTPRFTSAVGMLLAGYLAGPIIKGADGMRVGQQWLQAGLTELSRAGTSDANSTAETADFTPSSIRARG